MLCKLQHVTNYVAKRGLQKKITNLVYNEADQSSE